MAKDPAFLFYPGDWLGGTLTFSRSHKGAYMDLLMAQFNQGPLSLEDIRQVLGVDFDMWEQKLATKFEKNDKGLFYNVKLQQEIDKRKNFTKSRRENLNKKHHTETHKEDHTELRMENENVNVIENKNLSKGGAGGNYSPEAFDRFYSELLSSEVWVEQCAMHLRLPTKQDLAKYLREYLERENLAGELEKKPLQEVRRHFLNWARIEVPKRKTKAENGDSGTWFKIG